MIKVENLNSIKYINGGIDIDNADITQYINKHVMWDVNEITRDYFDYMFGKGYLTVKIRTNVLESLFKVLKKSIKNVRYGYIDGSISYDEAIYIINTNIMKVILKFCKKLLIDIDDHDRLNKMVTRQHATSEIFDKYSMMINSRYSISVDKGYTTHTIEDITKCNDDMYCIDEYLDNNDLEEVKKQHYIEMLRRDGYSITKDTREIIKSRFLFKNKQ